MATQNEVKLTFTGNYIDRQGSLHTDSCFNNGLYNADTCKTTIMSDSGVMYGIDWSSGLSWSKVSGSMPVFGNSFKRF